MKKTICLLMAILLLAAISACSNTQSAGSAPASTAQPVPAETPNGDTEAVPETTAKAEASGTMTAYRADGSAVNLEDCGDGTWKDADGLIYYPGEDGVLRARGADDLYTEIPAPTETDAPSPTAPTGRQDGERFESAITLEGMEETVKYEHVRNETIGFEMDYDYESFVRHTEPVCDRFVSTYDDPEDPQNYLEVSFNAQDADTIAASVCASLSDDYDVIQESYTLDRAGSCIRIDASSAKDNKGTPDVLQMVYIIPAADGCRIATAHYSFESAEGFGRRFSYMINTLEIIDRNIDSADAADYGEQPAADTSEWTGRDFGELPPEDFYTGADYGELSPEELEGLVDDGESPADTSEWTGRDYGELPPEDFYTGADYGELSPEELGG